MRRLGQPDVIQSAGLAALITALLCYPRLSLWAQRADPMWFLESMIFLGTMVLWGFVFAWHAEYSRRPVFIARTEGRLWGLATAGAILVAVLLHLFLDPTLRQANPQDFPANFKGWLAMTLFHLAFVQLFLVFAPFAWLIRLFQNRGVAIILTVLFGVMVLGLKVRSAATPVSSGLLAMLVILRIGSGFLSVLFYLRGGALLAWWWAGLIEARYLLTLSDGHPGP